MNRERLELWLTDLETTDAPQARGMLRQGDAFCCLGRLCEVAIAAGVEILVKENARSDYWMYGDCAGMPPDEVYDWMGHDHHDSLFHDSADMNDKDEMSFKEIAAAIRKDYA